MKRREFIAGLGAAVLPTIARAHQMRRIGILLTVRENDPATEAFITLFERRMQELGWFEARNIGYEKRYARGDRERMRANVAEIMRSPPDVIVAQNTPTVAELRRQTNSIPIVFVMVSDPVGDGFVKTLARPGTNATGFTNTMSSLGGKWVELLKETAPMVSRLGYLFNREAAPGAGNYYLQPLLSAATSLGVNPILLEIKHVEEIDRILDDFVAAGGNGIIGNSDSFVMSNRERIIAAVNRRHLPSIFVSTILTSSGGLMSYGADTPQQWHGAASYVDRILRGDKPGDLPVQLPTNFVLTINLKTAKAIGLDIPWFVQQRADKVIE